MFSIRRSPFLLGLAAQMIAMSQSVPNPLLTESPLAYHLPPFEQIKDEHFAPVFEQGMKAHLSEIEAIANNPTRPTFENTIVAMEQAGGLLERARRAFGIYTGSMTNPNLQKLEAAFAPRFAAHEDAIKHNRALSGRVQTLYD